MIKNILIAAICLGFIWHWSDDIYYQIQKSYQEIETNPEKLTIGLLTTQQNHIRQKQIFPNRIILKADRLGHFRGTVFINEVAMPFMIDTGATNTIIPIDQANKAKLPRGKKYQIKTVNGKTDVISTVIDKLRIGSAEAKNIDAGIAGINYALDEILIGMNTLKLFSMSIEEDEMILIAGNNLEGENRTTSAGMFNPYKTTKVIKNWKKSVICNSNGEDCKTIYSE